MSHLNLEERKKAVEIARDTYCNDDVEIDVGTETDNNNFSETDNGTWVRAWVWVDGHALGWDK
jgi:hypothetical protein